MCGYACNFLSHFTRVYLVCEVFQKESGALLALPESHKRPLLVYPESERGGRDILIPRRQNEAAQRTQSIQ